MSYYIPAPRPGGVFPHEGLIPVLAIAIRDVLTDELRRAPYAGDPNPMRGHCYVATEAYYHATGGKHVGNAIYQMNHEDAPHWWMRDPNGDIVDLTSDQFDTPVPYDAGKRRGFLTRAPSKRAREVLRRVRELAPLLVLNPSPEYMETL